MEGTHPFVAGPEILSQAEVERLLEQVTEQEARPVRPKSDTKSTRTHGALQAHDFRNPVFLSPGELRRLRLQHEDLIQSLAARMSIYLRLEVALQMSKLITLNFSTFAASLANPTHLTLFKVEPLRGICVLDISPRLGLTIVDRLMGGPGRSAPLERGLSEIEVALLDQAVHIIIGEWCSQWAGIQELRSTLLGHESNGQFLKTSQPDTIMLLFAMEVRLGDCVESIQIGIPYPAIEPLVRKLGLKLSPEIDEKPTGTPARVQWNPDLAEMPIPVTAEWPAMEVTAGELSRLKPGDVLQVDPEFLNQVQLRLANMPKFTGRLGTQGNFWAIEVTGVLKS